MPNAFRCLCGLLVLACWLAIPGAALAQKRPADWEKFCRISTDVDKALAKVKDPAERATKWSNAVLAGKPWGKGFTDAFAEMAAVEPTTRYIILQESAKEEGAAGWDCPAVRHLLEPSGSAHTPSGENAKKRAAQDGK